jgi:hypothetical protein
VTLGSNFQGSGQLFDLGPGGFFQAGVTINSGSCAPAVDP